MKKKNFKLIMLLIILVPCFVVSMVCMCDESLTVFGRIIFMTVCISVTIPLSNIITDLIKNNRHTYHIIVHKRDYEYDPNGELIQHAMVIFDEIVFGKHKLRKYIRKYNYTDNMIDVYLIDDEDDDDA